MSLLKPMNQNNLRIQAHRKLATKPRILNKNKLTKSMFRSQAYLYNTLPDVVTSAENISIFTKKLKIYMNVNYH